MVTSKIATLVRADIFAKTNIGTADQRKDLITQINISKKLNPAGSKDSNVGCWRGMNPCEDIDWLLSELNILLKEVVEFYENEDSVFKDHPKTNAKISYWANVNSPESRNVFHSHKSKHFSAVYYIQSKDTGGLRFVNPADVIGDCNVNAAFVRDFTFLPNDGDLVMWPAWMPHEVETNLSTKDRINLTFDIVFE